MTPSIPDDKETMLFHAKLKEACDKSDDNYYSDFKKNCDEYFYLAHRDEPRGVGGIFFDHLNTGIQMIKKNATYPSGLISVCEIEIFITIFFKIRVIVIV